MGEIEQQEILELCACANLWKPVENPVENSPSRTRDSMPEAQDKSWSSRGDLLGALVDAVDVLSARIDGLESAFNALLGILDRPLSPTESLEELRKLREGMA